MNKALPITLPTEHGTDTDIIDFKGDVWEEPHMIGLQRPYFQMMQRKQEFSIWQSNTTYEL